MSKMSTWRVLSAEKVAKNPNIPDKDKNATIILQTDNCETEKDCLIGAQLTFALSYIPNETSPRQKVSGLCLIIEDTLEQWCKEKIQSNLITKDKATLFFDYCPRCGKKINWDRIVPNGNTLSKIELMGALWEKYNHENYLHPNEQQG